MGIKELFRSLCYKKQMNKKEASTTIYLHSTSKKLQFWKQSIVYCNKLNPTLHEYWQDELDLSQRINYILNCWMIIEGVTKDAISYKLLRSLVKNGEIDKEQQKDGFGVLNKDWKKIKDIANKYNIDLEQIVGTQMWRTICKIDDLRNGIIHSNDLSIFLTNKDSFNKSWVVKNFRDAIDHFCSAAINKIDKTVMKGKDFDHQVAEIFNKEFLEYIFSETIGYCNKVCDALNQGFVKAEIARTMKV